MRSSGLVGALLAAAITTAHTQPIEFQSYERDGRITWSGAYTAGVVTVETALTPSGPWITRTNHFTTSTVGNANVPLSASNTFCRLLSVDISTNSPRHYTNLLESYGILETVAGRGRTNIDSSQWSNSFEGAWATNVDLSRPHSSFGDSRGNVLIVDQRSSAVLKVTPEGRLYTYAGTHIAGDNGDSGWATNLHLRFPNGGWLGTNDVFYVLDTENGKARKIYTNGWMETLFSTGSSLGDGRAFWVASDESVIYFGSGGDRATILNKWTSADNTIRVIRSDFKNMGNILCDERTGDLYISDREAYRVYRMPAGTTNLITIAGNGTQSGGGEGYPALQTGLVLPRSVWFIPNGGFLIGEHDNNGPGNRIWYVDPAGIIHLWMNGSGANNKRVGDGNWFYANPSLAKVSRVRTVNTDPFGNIIITESNYGYVRRIRFHRINP